METTSTEMSALLVDIQAAVMKSLSDETPALLTVKKAAVMMSLSERKIWEMTSTGELPTVRYGRALRIDRRDLAASIAANKR